jgi:hypothetical protein
MAVQKTIESVWGGDEAMKTHYGPTHYIMVEFDDGTNASVGAKPENLAKTRQKLYDLVGSLIEVKLELKDADGNKYRLAAYPGSYNGKDLKVIEQRPEGFVYPPGGEGAEGAPEARAGAESPPPSRQSPPGPNTEVLAEAILMRFGEALTRLSAGLDKLDGMVDVLDAIVRVESAPPPDEVSQALTAEEIAAQFTATLTDPE